MSKEEKGIPPSTPEKDDVPPAFQPAEVGEQWRDREDFWTRNGLNLRSFQKREYSGPVDSLDRTMKGRHLQMIAIGGSIGAGFFVGSGKALSNGGPASLFIDFSIIGIMMFNTVYALGELAVMFPVSGGFYTYSTRFIDPSWGFAMGWNYVMQWAVVLPLELTVCGITMGYWEELRHINVAVWITVFMLLIIIVNVFGTLGYAEEEFWSSCLKLGATVVFMIIAVVLVCGGGPEGSAYDEYSGGKLWHDPGAFANGFRGFCSVFVTAAFSFSGTELVGLAAAEARNPVKSLPGAIKQVFWRITLFYILGLTFVGLLIRHDDENLLGANPYVNVDASPFVLVGKYAHLWGFDSFMNVIILVSVLSIGVSAVYGGSRTLTALAQQGYAPKIFAYIDRSGRPLISVIFVCAFSPLAYVNLAAEGPEVFDWLLALSGLAALFTWGSICLAHIRFRKAWALQGHTLDEIPFKAVGGVWGSYLGLTLNFLVLIAQLYVAICPVKSDGFNDAEGFFKNYLALPVVIVFWIGGFIWKRTGWLRVSQIDVDTGRRELPWDEINEWRAQLAQMPAWKRIMHTFFI
ncbi:amino acid permease/ SLC12A domain-containing protein [Podospora australis]|uniref:Amino acid permease/ SLC12A domain-containing protein n=1 Tax=Podospora australis TaxID=1536484 RepID=A0AAN6WX63_9PEZI|nr:amino acid permease/ SLC12A domain-containing protein [Podospora australis]